MISNLIDESAKYPLLSSEEEFLLCKEYYSTKNINLRNTLIKHNLKLVVSISYKFPKKDQLDYINEGYIALIKAVEKFEPDKGFRFSTYATRCIKGYMFNFLSKNYRLVSWEKCSKQRILFFKLRKHKKLLISAGIEPTIEMLAKIIGVPEKEISNIELAISSEFRIDDEEEFDILKSDAIQQDEEFSTAQLNNRLNYLINQFKLKLSNKEKIIFDKRLLDDDLSLRELAPELGISYEMVRKLENKISAMFKRFLCENNFKI